MAGSSVWLHSRGRWPASRSSHSGALALEDGEDAGSRTGAAPGRRSRPRGCPSGGSGTSRFRKRGPRRRRPGRGPPPRRGSAWRSSRSGSRNARRGARARPLCAGAPRAPAEAASGSAWARPWRRASEPPSAAESRAAAGRARPWRRARRRGRRRRDGTFSFGSFSVCEKGTRLADGCARGEIVFPEPPMRVFDCHVHVQPWEQMRAGGPGANDGRTQGPARNPGGAGGSRRTARA